MLCARRHAARRPGRRASMRSVLRRASVGAAREHEARRGREAGAHASAGGRWVGGLTMQTQSVPFDPIRLCVYTTIALLAWIVSPPVMMMAMSALGFVAYVRAMRAGLDWSKCILRAPRLVLVYLGSVFTLGAAAVAMRIMR